MVMFLKDDDGDLINISIISTITMGIGNQIKWHDNEGNGCVLKQYQSKKQCQEYMFWLSDKLKEKGMLIE